MAKRVEGVTEKLMKCAKEEFLEKGFRDASLRTIAEKAESSKGAIYIRFPDKESLFSALVEPVVQGTKNMYAASEEETYDVIDKGFLNQIYEISYKSIAGFINYIYDNFDCFKLLLMCSDGTKYSNFVDDIVTLEVNSVEEFWAILKQKKIEFNELKTEDIHLLIHSYYSSIFEVVAHDFTRERALEHAHILKTFYNAGWRAIFVI